jgi:hypothetical protein
LAAFDDGVARLTQIVNDVAAREEDWLTRIRAVLSALVKFLDEEPHWARFLILQAPAAAAVLERRQRALTALARALKRETDTRTAEKGAARRSPQLTAELVVGGVFSVIRARLLDGPREPLLELLPTLTSLVLAQYRGSGAGPGGEQAQRRCGDAQTPNDGLPVRATYRTTRVLSAIGASPRLSNREIACAAGLSDEGQTSKLLRRLERRGLIENVGLGQPYGEANAWLLTDYGERVLDATRHSLVPGAGAVRSRRIRGAA